MTKMKPYDVNLIADYIIIRLNSDEKSNLINLKLKRLLYYFTYQQQSIQKHTSNFSKS